MLGIYKYATYQSYIDLSLLIYLSNVVEGLIRQSSAKIDS